VTTRTREDAMERKGTIHHPVVLASLVAGLGPFTAIAGARTDDPLPSGPAAWGLATLADCEAPDGSTFTTEIVSLPGGPLRFVQVHPAGRTELLLVPDEGGATERVFRRDEGTGEWGAVGPAMASFLEGHDVHRLFLTRHGPRTVSLRRASCAPRLRSSVEER
jgi:hypothetical protein